MEKIYLSDSGPKVSPAIYGFYRWGKQELGSEKMDSIVNLCLDLGINTFDHADIYGDFNCETAFGDWFKRSSRKREEIVLFTKCGLLLPSEARPEIRGRHYNTSKEHIIQSLENSLKNLRTDYVDVFLLNQLDPLSNLEETALALEKLKDSGKVKNIGVVNFSVFQHQLLSSFLRIPIVTNHIELNLLNTTAFQNGQVDYIKQKFMRPLATSPLAAGQIANSTMPKAVDLREKLQEIGDKMGENFESIAIAWLIKLGALPLIGTTNPDRIKHIVKAFSVDLDRQDWYELYFLSKGEDN